MNTVRYNENHQFNRLMIKKAYCLKKEQKKNELKSIDEHFLIDKKT